MKWDIYEIDGSSFHFGKHGLGNEESSYIFSSDSLFAALVASAAALFRADDLTRWLSSFENDNPLFILTSAFPRAGHIRFFPLPLYRKSVEVIPVEGGSNKKIKKITLISEQLFRRILNGGSIYTLFTKTKKLQNETLLISDEEFQQLPLTIQNGGSIWKQEKRPRVTLDRKMNASTLFFSGQTQFNRECGLWFGLKWLAKDEENERMVSLILENLSLTGIGGERSVGSGSCQIEKFESIDLPDAVGLPWVSLSRYIPAADEMKCLNVPFSAYTLEPVGGWLHSPGQAAERRRVINMICEGAVLGDSQKNTCGRMVDVQPNYEGTQPVGHPVWRNGFAAAVGYPALEKEQENGKL